MTRPAQTSAPEHARPFWKGLARRFAHGAALGAGLLAVGVPAWMYAAPVGTLQSFSTGTVADATAVNANFTALKTAVDSHETQLTAATPTVFANSGPVHTTETGPTVIRFTSEAVDTDDSYDPATSRFTAKVAGNYLVSATWMSYNRGTHTRFGLHRNGVLFGSQQYALSTQYARAAASWVVPMVAGQYIEIKGDLGSAGEINIHPDFRTLTIQLVK